MSQFLSKILWEPYHNHSIFTITSEHGLSWGFSWSFSALPGKFRDSTSSRPKARPFKSFPIHYRLISTSLKARQPQTLTASLNNQLQKVKVTTITVYATLFMYYLLLEDTSLLQRSKLEHQLFYTT
jgi:hypothetical protein